MPHKKIVYISVLMSALCGCTTTMEKKNSISFKNYSSVEAMIVDRRLNQSTTQGKDYVYDWGPHVGNQQPQTQQPKQAATSYCAVKGGELQQLYGSHFAFVENNWSKKLLATYASVRENIGVYQCKQKDGQQWIISIEPIAERKLSQEQESRVVTLFTQVITPKDAEKIYAKHQKKSILAVPIVESKAATNVNTVKSTPVKPAEVKKEDKAVPEPTKEVVKETVQQQQQRLYLGARRDLNRGVNQLAACNQAQQAHNLGRFYNSSGPNIYIESGVLVAKCLTTVPAYQKKFVNPNARAKTILQEIVNLQNHTVAKHMLNQLK